VIEPVSVFVRPRLSVTTAVNVTVPADSNTGLVQDAEVPPDAIWTEPAPPVDAWNATDTGVDPDAPATPVTFNVTCENPRTYKPQAVGTALFTRTRASVPTGTTDTGTVTVNTASLDPIKVDPLYVSTITRPAADPLLGINAVNDDGTVHATDVPTPVATVPDCPRNSHFTVCVNDDTARVILIVTCCPASPDTACTVEALGIVAGVNVPDTDAVPTPVFFPWYDAEQPTLIDPSAVCVTVHEPDATGIVPPTDTDPKL
jgi:hypothetical protein